VFPPAGGSYTIGRYNPTTNTWTGLGVFTSGSVSSLATLPSGDVMVGGGLLTTAGGVTVNGIGRCNPSTDSWTGLGSGVSRVSNANVGALVALPNGDVIAAGSFTSAGGVAVNSIARYTFGSAATSITGQPQPMSVCHAGTASFSVAASGSSLAYQWQVEDGAVWRDIGEGAEIILGGVPSGQSSGSTTAQFRWFNAPVRPHLGRVRCVVSSACGSVTSNAATLTVCGGDFNCDSSTDFFDYLDFVDAFTSNAANADFNGDGSVDFFDYLDFVDAFTTGC
jgi:hypothetical protein